MNLLDFKNDVKMSSQLESQLWNVIHIIGATYQYTTESVKAVKYFFDALVYLLPVEEYRENLQNFMKNYPIEKYFNGEKFQSFYWTYLYHDYINKLKYGSMGNSKIADKVLSLEQAVKKYSEIDKGFWTSSWWGITHILAKHANYSCKSTCTINRKKYMQLLLSYVTLIPCKECRMHWNDLLKSEHTILHKILNGEEINVFAWSVYLHNKVNKRLGKSILSLKDAIQLY